tara:strand:+ start:102 stop:572 length:471 start_codon:yes stop_codon:yes gene_type:complete
VKVFGFVIPIIISVVGANASIYPVEAIPQKLSPLMERELRGCFDFFWSEWNSDPMSPTYGMTNGDYVGMKKYSPLAIEEQGFYFAAIIIGIERGWIERKELERKLLGTHPMPYKPFGAETSEEIMKNWDIYKAIALRCSPITHLTKDDPPCIFSIM